MAYKDFCEKFKDLIAGWKKFAAGESSTVNAEVEISTAYELNALKNSASAEQLVQLGNAYYDQVAIGRSIKELYKRPKHYLAEHYAALSHKENQMGVLNEEVEKQHKNVKKTIELSKSSLKVSTTLSKKLSKIKSEFDA